MEVKNIGILYNESELTKEQVVADLKSEGYTHNFLFINPITLSGTLDRHLKTIDEVWLFKDCSKMWQYEYFKSNGKDIWVMG